MYNRDYSVNKTCNCYKESEINNVRTFFLNLLETLPQPVKAYEVCNLINTLGLAILYTYPELGKDGYYYVG